MKRWISILIDDQGMTTVVPQPFLTVKECVRTGEAWQATIKMQAARSLCVEQSTSYEDTVPATKAQVVVDPAPAKPELGTAPLVAVGIALLVLAVFITHVLSKKDTEK